MNYKENHSQEKFLRRVPEGLLKKKISWVRKLRIDPILMGLLIALLTVSLFILYSAANQSAQYFWDQLKFAVFGLTAILLVVQVPIHFWQQWGWALYVVVLLFLIAVLFIGDLSKGAQRWLNLGFRFQPSELLKVTLPMVISSYLVRRLLPPKSMHILVTILLIALPLVLIVMQPDLGSAVLIAFSGGLVIFLAGLSWRFIAVIFVVLVGSTPLLWNLVLHEYQKSRIMVLLRPSSDKLGEGWNIIQSKTAIGSGGWSGKGWLQGTQSQLDFLPEGHTDFIVAVLAEEFGFKGVLLLMLLYLLIIARGVWISLHSASVFGFLLSASIILTFAIYIFVNVGMVSGLLPIVGVPLPLISYGGTSLLTLLVGFGILMRVASEVPETLAH